MADKKILLFAVLLLAACTADPAMDGADGGNSSANTAAAAKLINTPYDAKQGSLIVCFDDAAVPTIEATAASFAATSGRCRGRCRTDPFGHCPGRRSVAGA